MKSKWVFLAVLLISNVLYAQKPESIIVKASVAPVIDGVVDDVWAETDSNVIDKNFSTDVPTLGDVGTTYWKALWNDDGMYILLVVNDDEWRPAYLNGATDNWMYDKPEIYFDVNYILADGFGPSVGQGHYNVSPPAIEGMIDGTPATDGYGVVYSFKVEDPIYLAEYFVPWSFLKDRDGIDFNKTNVMGFDVTIIDKDAADDLGVRNRAVWANTGNINESWINMDDCGLITLEGADSAIYIESINLTGGNITEDNGTLQIAATILPANATNKDLKWSVFTKEGSDGRATIDQNGLLTALTDGVVVVSATSQDGSYITETCEVTISGQRPTSDELNLISNGNFDLYDNITKAPYSWGGWIDTGYGDPYAVEGSNVVLNNTLVNPIENWHYQFSQTNLNALPDIPYVVSFVAWAANDRNITFDFEDTSENGYNRYGYSTDPESTGRSEWTFPITTVPTRFTFHVTFDQILPSTIQKITFFISQALGAVYLDSISLISEADLALINSYPVLNTVNINPVSSGSVLCESNVISDGGNIITERGVCWNTSPDPTVFDSKIIDGAGTGSFTTNISGLNSNATYFFRTYAINAKGTFYGNTLSVFTDDCSNIGMVGTFNNWGNDSTDVLLENISESPCSWQKVHTFYEKGEVKFRKNYDWLMNWGSNEFPSGISLQFGPNIPVPAGMYQITFNSNTGEFNFELTESLFNDSLALVALYNATEGSAWNNNENWLNGPVSTWHGITVTNNRVTGINLSQNNLNGFLPAELGQLSALQQLVLWENNLQGTIPAGLGELSNLVNLDLGINQLSGVIPAEIGNLNNLEYLYLGAGNQLTGTIPPALGQLSKLKILALDRNLLTGSIPVSFGNLDSIQTVFLYSNQFTGALPGEFLNLTKLVYLDIQRNQIDYIPELKNIPTLNHLDCSYNKLTFSDIEKNTGINEFYYSPQANIGEEQYYTLNIGENFVYSIVTGGTQNKYQWYKDGNILANQSASTLEINILEPTDAGTYYCQVTSDLVPDLVISSQNINLSVTTDICYNVGLVGTFNQWGNDNSDLMMEQDAENSCFWSIIQKFDDDGEVKFRRDYDWNVSWGNTGFPYDTASLQGPNIPVPAGTYEITFNSGTGVYNFQAINVSCNLIDSLALVAIYNTTNGPGWSRNDNWLNGPVQTWYGVTMNPDGRVIGLNLVRNGLNGFIPSEIGNLSELRRLHLGNYKFLANWNNWNNLNYQPLPVSMANLTKIEILSLDVLQFNSMLPDIFGGMSALRELYIRENYFTNGTLPEGIGACYNLKLLGIEYNNFSQIPDLTGCTKLQNFMAYGCYFSFEDIEPNLWIPGFNYSNQRLILGTPESLNPALGETITRTIEVGGSNNIYQWLKDGVILVGQNTNTLTLENVSEADAGVYNLRVTNSAATQLTLSSHSIILYQEQTPIYTALVALYNSTGGNNWYRRNNWLSNEPITNWEGVNLDAGNGLYYLSLYNNNLVGTLPQEFGDLSLFYSIEIANNPGLNGEIPTTIGQLHNLQHLYLHSNNLTGSIPAEINDCDGLFYFTFVNNNITGLPDFSGMNNIYTIYVSNNKLEFDDIIPNVGQINNFNYSPQKNYGEIESIPLEIGSSVTFNGLAGGDGNIYQWYKNKEILSGETGTELVLDTLSLDDIGTYICQVTNPAAPGLTLVSEPKSLYDESQLDEFEPDNDFLSAQEITNSDYQRRNLFPAGDRDIAWFEITQPSQVQIWMSNGEWNSRQLTVYAPDTTNVLASGSDYCTFTTLVPGVYYVKAWSQNSEMISEYFLDIEITPFTIDAYEPDNTWADAKQIFPFFAQTDHNLKPIGDEDYLKFEITDAPRTVTIDVFDEIYCRNFNLWLYGSDGVSELSFSSGGAVNCGAGLQYTIPENGTYYLKTKVPWQEMYDYYTISVVTDGQPPMVACNEQDSLALVAIYNATNGSNWYRNDNWLTGSVLTWYGVTMNPDGRVTGLNLVGNMLQGYLPSEIGNLTELQKLQLGNNMFNVTYGGSNFLNEQPLPQNLENLTKLQVLALDQLNMSNELPDIFGGMTVLRELYIQNNYFTNQSLPGSITSCNSLERMDINGNDFSQLPDLSALSKLNTLQASGCYFSFEDIEPNLWVLEFNYSGQRLVLGTPESLNPALGETITRTILVGGEYNLYQWFKNGMELAGQTTNTLTLENVSSQDAGIYTLRVTNSMATQLTLGSHAVILYQNQLPVYDALVALYNSTDGSNWYNNTNWLSDQPVTTWFGITINPSNGLMSLGLYNNNLVGTLPPEFGDLSIFYQIQIAYNSELTGEIPASIGQLTNLQYLILNGNKLTGTIPSSFGQLLNLRYLILSNNSLTGDIPAEIGDMINLFYFDLSRNHIQNIPSEVTSCSNLRYLIFNDNSISVLPNFAGMDYLYRVTAYNNKLEFDDVIPLVGQISSLNYAPQDSIGEFLVYNNEVGDSFSYTLVTPGELNQYQWYKNDVLLNGQTSSTLAFGSLTLNEKGTYYCLVTNPQAPDLTLVSRKLILNIDAVNNLKMLALTTLVPLSNSRAFCGLSSNEIVSVRFTNTGKDPVSNFNVGYSVDGNPITEETFTGTINPGDTIDYTFATGVDLTTNEYYKTFTFGLYLVYNDDNPADNSLNRTREVFGNYTDLPHWSTFNSCDGMLSDISWAIAEDKNGNIWSTDFYGASKFDGENWTTYTTADGLGANYSWAMINDKDGNIWFAGATDSVITKYDGTSFTQYPQPGSFEECIYVDSNGNLWFGSWTAQGIAKYDGTSWTYFMNGEVNFGSNIYSIGEDANGNILVSAQENGVPKIMQFDGSTWTDFVIPGNTSIISEVFFDSKGYTWFTEGSNVFRYDGVNWAQYCSTNGTIGYCEDISEDIYGNIWFAGGSEVVKYDGSFRTKYSKEDGLAAANLSLFAIKGDSKGNIWVGSYGAGITKYAPSGNIKMLALTTPAPLTNGRAYCGLSNNEPLTVSFTNTGDVSLSDFDLGYNLNGSFGALETYIGTINPGDTLTHTFASGVDFTTNEYIKTFNFEFYVEIDDDNSDDNLINRTKRVFGDYTDLPNWTTYNSCDGMLSDISFAIAEDKNGNIWSTDFYGASKFDGENWTTYTTADGLGDNYSWAMINDKDGNIWFAGANDSIITKYDGSAFAQYPQPGSFEECIYQDSQGNLWFGSWQGCGVAKYDGTNWTYYPAADYGLGSNVVSIGEDINGKLYFSTSDRVVVFDGTTWSPLSWPGQNTSVTEIFVDSKKNVWFASDGFYKFDGSAWSQFTTDDGAIFTDDIAEDIYGNIWFGGGKKLVKYDGNTFAQFTVADGMAAATAASIYAVHADKNGNVWVGTYLGGISKLEQLPDPCPQHYHPIWEGTLGFDHMNINVIGARYDGMDLESGDEIGVFDGDICVGYGKVTGPIGLQNILSIKVSRDDGTGNGFTSGNEVTYRIWDCSDSSEYTVQEVTCYDIELNLITCSPFEAGGTSFVELSGKGEECFTLEFRTGWNLFSVPVLMDSTNMMYVFQPMIDSKSLVKIQDELGNSLENWGIFGGWQNNIGEIGLTEGYKIKVNWLDSINVCGQHVKYPYAIALQTGWNIIGYPQSGVYDAQEVVQQLINRNTLLKVQDELGNSLENWGIFGGWQNHIGNLLPGEGYKVKVIAQDTLWIYENYTKSGAIQPELVASTHFRQNYAGNGVDHMNINLVGLPINVLQAGDEFAVFEGEACVGAVTLTQHNINNQSVQLTASAFDGQAAGGFTEGSRFTLKLWSLATGAEYTITPEILSGSATFAKHETTVASLEKYTITGFDEIAGLEGITVRCYPNPFSESVTIEINLSTEAEVEVEVLNQLGQVVSELIPNQRRAAGLHQLVWNGRNTQGQQVTPGMYHLRVSMNESVLHRKVIFSK